MLVAISDAEFRQLRDAIRARFGIFYDDTKQFLLQSRLQTRLVKRSLGDFNQYYRFLMTHPQREDEWDVLACVLSNNETYFFRERAQLDVLTTEVIEEVLQGGDGNLRVWSAGCASGEEAFSLAITLVESRRLRPSQIHIIASDISPRAIEKCVAGLYRELSFRATPPEMIQKYFEPFAQGFMIKNEIKRMVKFARINLMDSQNVAGRGRVDAIFCRNVLIYFDKATQKKVVEGFAKALRPGGYLFLGHAESIMRLTDLYKPVVTATAIYYRLRADAH